MTKQHHFSAVLVAIVAGLVLASADTLLANGEQFFIPAGGRQVELAYFARVKDARTGRPIRVAPYVSIVDPITGIYIPFQGDGPGHFRSPDVGAAIKEVSSPLIDTKQLEITISAAGYQTMKIANVPRQSKGIVELDVKMEPKGGATPVIEKATLPGTAGGNTAPTDSSKPTIFLLAACLGVAAISAVARTVGRPESTTR